MVLLPLPIPIIDLLTSYDLASHPRSSYPVNFLLGNWKITDEGTIKGNMILPILPDSRFVQTEKFNWPSIETTEHSIEYPLSKDVADVLANNEVLYFHKVLTRQISNFHWKASPTYNSLVIPWTDSCDTRYTYLELFAGGYGGWHHGLKLLQNNQLPNFHVIGVEASLQAAVQHCLNHKTCLIPEGVTIPWDFTLNMDHDILFNMKIQSVSWQQTVALAKPFIWFLSPPCQPWSSPGLSKGLNSDDGKAFIEAVCLARIHRPTVILLEEVAGFRVHDHFVAIIAVFKWAGYELYRETTFDMVRVLPIRRERWLAIFVLKDFCQNLDLPEWLEFVLDTPPRPRGFDIQLNMTSDQHKIFEPSYKDACTYMDPKYLPRGTPNATKEDVLRYRIPGLDKSQHTIMAQYGNQHSLPEHLLQEKGLMGFFVRTPTSFRYWSPAEILMMHLHVAPATLLKPPKLSWFLLGNAICLPHVLLLQTNALRILFGTDRVESPSDALQRVVKDRLQASKIRINEDHFAWYIAKTPWEVADAKAFLDFFLVSLKWKGDANSVFPPGTWFHPSKGLIGDHRIENQQQVESVPVSPTLPFQLTSDLMLFAIPGEYGIITIMNSMTWKDILQIWNFNFVPQDDHDNFQLHQIINQDFDEIRKHLLVWNESDQIMNPCDDEGEGKLILYYEQERLLVLKTKAMEWKDIQQEGMMQSLDYDSMCVVTPNLVIKKPILMKSKDDNQKLLPFIVNPELLSQLEIETIVPPKTDILLLRVKGSPTAIDMMILFWSNLFDQNWLQSRGRVMNIQLLDANNIRILFRPHMPVTALPTSFLRGEMQMRILRSYLASSVETIIAPPNIIFKFAGRAIFRGKFPLNFSFDKLRFFLHAFVMNCFGDTPSMITLAKTIGEGTILRDLLDKRMQLLPGKEGPIMVVIQEPIFGGGKTPTSKQEFQQVLHAGIAGLLLEYGMTLPMASNAVEKLMESVGQQRIHHMLHQQTPNQRYSTFETICNENKIELPKKGPQKAKSAAKFARTLQNDRIHASKQIPAEQYTLQEGFFQTADQKPLTVLTQFSSFASGICLMNAENAEQRISQGKVLNPDELGIFVLGNINVPGALEHRQLQAPAHDPQGRSVLLEGTLVQLGAKHIKTPTVEKDGIPTKDIYVASVTLLKQDWEPDMWNRICEAPVRTVKHLLALEGHAEILGKPWARTFKDGNLKVPIELATTIQFYAEFDATKFSSLLQRSGFNKIYIGPKNNLGAPHDNWKVIWVTGNIEQVEAQAASLSGAAGLVKGKKSLGIRVESSVFEKVWAILKPNVNPPDTRTTSLLFKIQPLPHGTDKEALQKWSEDTKWEFKPIRAIGARTWLLGSNSNPPTVLVFNGQPLIAESVQPRTKALGGAIVAGPKYLPKTFQERNPDGNKNQQKGYDPFRTGDPYADPWTSYSGQSIAAENSKPFVPSKPAKSADLTSGPIGTQFQQQESRIQAVEQAIHQLQGTQQTFQDNTNGKFSALEAQINQQNHDQIQAIATLQESQKKMHDSLANALQNQDTRITNAFDDLRQIFLSQNRGKKRGGAETEEDQDM